MPFEQYLTNELRKQHINLSSYAWSVIENDISYFCPPEKNKELSYFINKIYKNYSELLLFPTNIDESLHEKFIFYKNYIINNTSADSYTAEKAALKMINKDVDEIKKTISHYINGDGRKIYLHVDTLDSLSSIPENSFIDKIFKRPGKYLKSIMEEYSVLPYVKREKIFFNDFILTINDAITMNYVLLITTGTSEYEVLPYKITTDSFNTYHYLVGYISDENNYLYPVSFRISRICNIKIKRKIRKLTNNQKKELDDTIAKRGAQFIIKDTITVRVKLTSDGIKKYNSQLYLRPVYKKIIDNNIYEFDITEFQAAAYFFKFGKDAEIIYPESIRNKFIKEYTDALNTYIQI